MVKYEEELCGAREKERQEGGLLLDALSPNMSENCLGPERQEPELPYVKEEESEPPGGKRKERLQCPNIKKEEQLEPHVKEEEDFTEMPVTGVHVRTEDEEGQHDEKKRVEPPNSISSQYMTTDSDVEHGGGSQADDWLAPLSDGEETSHPPYTGTRRVLCPGPRPRVPHQDNLLRGRKGETASRPFPLKSAQIHYRLVLTVKVKAHGVLREGHICGRSFSLCRSRSPVGQFPKQSCWAGVRPASASHKQPFSHTHCPSKREESTVVSSPIVIDPSGQHAMLDWLITPNASSEAKPKEVN